MQRLCDATDRAVTVDLAAEDFVAGDVEAAIAAHRRLPDPPAACGD